MLRVHVADGGGRALSAGGLAGWLARVAPARARGEVGVAVVSDARVRALNKRYRRRDYATDVLSFPMAGPKDPPYTLPARIPSPEPPPSLGPASRELRRGTPKRRSRVGGEPRIPSLQPPASSPYLGDIVIALGVARRQARAAGHSELTELRVLALHGLLHLLGYDHERDAGTMARVERSLRRKGGLRESLLER